MKVEKKMNGLKVYAQTLTQRPEAPKDLVGVIDELEADEYIRIRKEEHNEMKRYWIPGSWIDTVDEEGVHLNKTIDEVKGGMMDQLP